MKYRVFNKVTKEDITNKDTWVVTPDGQLAFNEWGDLLTDPEAIYILEEDIEEFLREGR